jgi:ribosome-binding protein aMBF1 (putative translation factor)
MNFALQVRETRHRLQLTQQELAAEIERSPQTVSNYETARVVPWPKEQARVLMKLLELTAARPRQRQRVCERI